MHGPTDRLGVAAPGNHPAMPAPLRLHLVLSDFDMNRRKVEHLPPLHLDRLRICQGGSAAWAVLEGMAEHAIWLPHLLQKMRRMPFLPSGLSTAFDTQARGSRSLGVTIGRRWLATVLAVLGKLRFQFNDTPLQALDMPVLLIDVPQKGFDKKPLAWSKFPEEFLDFGFRKGQAGTHFGFYNSAITLILLVTYRNSGE